MTSTTASRSTFRTIMAISTMFLPLIAVLGSFLLWRDRLPPELASHWSDAGAADGVMTVPQYLTLALAVTGAAALASVIVGVWPGLRAATRRGGFLIAGCAAGVAAQTWLVSASLTMQAGDPFETVLGLWSILGFAAIGYGLIPFFIAPKPRQVSHDVPGRIDLRLNENGAWSRTITARIFLFTAFALIVAEIAIYAFAASKGKGADAVFGLLIGVVAIVVLAALSRFQITADWRGLRVVSSLLRVPLKRIRLEDISAVEIADLVPSEWGGWGYRILPGRSALILRKGPGLIVTTSNNKKFALTLDYPDVPAALLATLRDRRCQTEASAPGVGV